MMIDLQEPINVWVFFKGTSIQPYLFFWKGQQIRIDSINFVHSKKEGNTTFYYFSVSAAGNFYRLKFDSLKLKWFLESLESG